MTDEQFGRAWAAENAVRPPDRLSAGRWMWHDAEENGRTDLHAFVLFLLNADFHPSEGAAYAALGAAVRLIRRETPCLKDGTE